jgi:transcriptional regulator with XRE-family HTH domain
MSLATCAGLVVREPPVLPGLGERGRRLKQVDQRPVRRHFVRRLDRPGAAVADGRQRLVHGVLPAEGEDAQAQLDATAALAVADTPDQALLDVEGVGDLGACEPQGAADAALHGARDGIFDAPRGRRRDLCRGPIGVFNANLFDDAQSHLGIPRSPNPQQEVTLSPAIPACSPTGCTSSRAVAIAESQRGQIVEIGRADGAFGGDVDGSDDLRPGQLQAGAGARDRRRGAPGGGSELRGGRAWHPEVVVQRHDGDIAPAASSPQGHCSSERHIRASDASPESVRPWHNVPMANDNRSDDRQAEMRAWMRGVLHERNRARGRGKRKGRRLSQAGLADVLGIDPSGVSRTINDGTAKDPPWFVTLDFLLGFARYTGEDIPIRFLAGFDVARLEGLLVSGREIQAPSDTEPKLVPAPSWPDGTLLAVRVVGDAGRPDYGDGVLLYYPPADGPPTTP